MSIMMKTSTYSPGDVFYYKSKKKTYGGVFLYCQQDYYNQYEVCQYSVSFEMKKID